MNGLGTWVLVTVPRAVPPTVPPIDPLGPVTQDPDRVRDTACRLVASDRVCRPPKPPDLRPVSGLGWVGQLLELLVLLLFVAMVVALVVMAVRALLGRDRRRGRRRRRRGRDTDNEVELLGEVQIDPSREPSQWRRDADEHRRAGRFRDALRCRYRALVGDLARSGWIDEIPGRTTGEERTQLAIVLSPASDAFDAAAELFDATWYGDRRATEADVTRIEQLEREVLQVAASRTPERREAVPA